MAARPLGPGLGVSATTLRAACAAGAGFVAFTAVWIGLGILNTGDAFPQGPARVWMPMIVVGPLAAAWMGWRRAGRRFGVAVAVLAVLAVAWWVLVPDGWWAVGPPMPGTPGLP